MSNQVSKALSPEESTLLGNIKSMIAELEQMSGAKAEEPKPEVEKPAEEKPGEEEAGKATMQSFMKTMKAFMDSGKAGSDAEKPAEEKVEDGHSEDEKKEIAEVAKMLRALMGKQVVAKSADPMIEAMEGLAKVVKSAIERQEQSESVMKAILDANGITKQFEIAKAQKEAAAKPADNSNEVLKALANLGALTAPKQTVAEWGSPNGDVAKALRDKDLLHSMMPALARIK